MSPRPPDAEAPETLPDRRFPPLDRSVWRRWRAAVRAFATSEVGGRAKALTTALLLLLLAAPRFAVLDRPALVLGPERAAHALALLAAASITTVTFAPDPALADQHDARLELFDDGRWTWTPLRAESRSA